jgi:hypothetical protein
MSEFITLKDKLYPFRWRDEHQDPSYRDRSLDFQDDCTTTKKGRGSGGCEWAISAF